MSFFGDNKGSSWSGMLKQALNNVESKLDKVLDFPEEDRGERVPPKLNISPRTRTVSRASDPLSGNQSPVVIKEEPKPSPTTLNKFKDEIFREEKNFPSPIKKTISETKPSQKKASEVEKQHVGKVKKFLPESKVIEKDYQAIAEQREKQLINAIQGTSVLNETINNLQAELSALKTEKSEEETRLTEIIKELELKVSRNDILNSIPDGNYDQKLLKQVEELQGQLEAKTEQMSDLLAEGEKLSKKELKMSTILQKLRAKEADSDKALGECQKKLGQSVKEVSDLKNKINSLSSLEKTQAGSVRALNSKVDQLTKDKERLELQVLKLKESESTLKGTLSKTQRDLKSLESESSKSSQESLSAAFRKEKQENQRLSDEVLAMKAQLEEIQLEAQQSVLEMRQTLSRSQDEFSFREEELLKEIKDWQDRQTSGFQYNITPVDADMDSLIEASKKPLLSEIASLKDQINQLQLKYNSCERELKQCIAQSGESKRASEQAQLSLAQERLAKEEIIENLEDSVGALQLKLQELQKALDKSTADKNNVLSRIEELQAAFKTTNTKHTQELELLRKRYEFESSNLPCLQSPNVADMDFSGSPARISLDAPSLFSSNAPKSPAGEQIEFSDVRSEKSTHSSHESSQASFDAKLRSLQIQLAASIEARDHLSSDLIRVTSRLKQFEKNLVRLETLELEHKDLLLKHETALILLGEKEEQVSELKADIQEMKEEYRAQISELVAKLNESPE